MQTLLRCSHKGLFLFFVLLCLACLCLNMFHKHGFWYSLRGHIGTGPTDWKTYLLLLYTNKPLPNDAPVKETHEVQAYMVRIDNTASASAYSDTTKNTTTTTTVQPSVTNWCPEKPPFLVGQLAGMAQEVTPHYLVETFPEIENGGRMRPKDCTSRQRLALVIPYRNRYQHLHTLLHNLLPILKRQQADVTIFVIEQAPPEVFNRGALMNIGFLESQKLANFDCYIFHDVDMIPLNDHNMYRCEDNPRHYAVAIDKFGYKLVYKGYFGAVIGFTKTQYLTINGCSNIYFGWGGEDDDLYNRVRNKKYSILRYDEEIARYNMIRHGRDLGNEVNPIRGALLDDGWYRQDVEGLNTTKYTVNRILQEKLYTWINVSLNMTEIFHTAPKRTLDIINKSLAPSEKITENH